MRRRLCESSMSLQNCIEENILTSLKPFSYILDLEIKSSPRHISTGQLRALLLLHTLPINLIIFEVSY